MSKLEEKLRKIYDEDTSLARKYDEMEEKAESLYEKEVKVARKTDPHYIRTEIISNPSPKGVYTLRLRGYPIDFNTFEKFLIGTMTPHAIVTLMRYNDARSLEEFRMYTRYGSLRSLAKMGRGIGILFLIGIGAVAAIFVGYLFINGTIPRLLSGLFGGFMP